MIRNLCDISEKELSYLRTHPIEVYEKLDLIRFRVECTNVDGLGGITEIKTSKGSIIDDVDCVVNTVMKDIVDFVDSNIGFCQGAWKKRCSCYRKLGAEIER